MKSIILSLIATTSLIIAGSALATEMPAIGKSKCGACHAVDRKVMGPAFVDVAAKYKGDKNPAGKIAASITKGGSFGWKLGVMPAKGMGGMATDADIKTMSEFIAGLAK